MRIIKLLCLSAVLAVFARGGDVIRDVQPEFFDESARGEDVAQNLPPLFVNDLVFLIANPNAVKDGIIDLNKSWQKSVEMADSQGSQESVEEEDMSDFAYEFARKGAELLLDKEWSIESLSNALTLKNSGITQEFLKKQPPFLFCKAVFCCEYAEKNQKGSQEDVLRLLSLFDLPQGNAEKFLTIGKKILKTLREGEDYFELAEYYTGDQQ